MINAMKIFSLSLAFRAGNSPVTGEFHSQRPVTRSFDVFFDQCENKWLSKQSWGWWFEMPLRPLWRHCNVKFLTTSLMGVCTYVKAKDLRSPLGWLTNPAACFIWQMSVGLNDTDFRLNDKASITAYSTCAEYSFLLCSGLKNIFWTSIHVCKFLYISREKPHRLIFNLKNIAWPSWSIFIMHMYFPGDWNHVK